MSDDLDHPPPLRERELARGVAGPILLGAVVLALASFLAYRWLRPVAPPPPVIASEGAAPAPAPASTPLAPTAPTAPDPPLPELDASDEIVRELLRSLSGDAVWAAWIEGDALVRRLVAGVQNAAGGRLPKPLLELLPVRGEFRVASNGGRLTIDDATFARHDGAIAALESIDLAAAARLWRWIRPLAETAWAEIAPPDSDLAGAVRQAIDHLLSTPAPPARIELVASEGLYRFADPAFEALTPVQKLLLRLGPERGERLRAWLRSLQPLV